MSAEKTILSPFICGRAVRGDEFVGRQAQLRTIFNRIRLGDSTAIVGDPHIGKTSLLLKLTDGMTQQEYLGDDARGLVVSRLDLHPIAKDCTYTPATFWAEALESLEQSPIHSIVAHQLEEAVKAGYPQRSLQQLLSRLGSENRRLVLLLDEFDVLLDHPNFQTASFFTSLRSLASTGGLVLVTASRFSVAEMNERGRQLLDVGSPFFNPFIQVRLLPFEEQTVDVLLGWAGEALSSNDRRFIRRMADCHPFLLQCMAAALMETTGHDRQARAARTFYERISFHFDDLWNTLDDRTRTTAVILSLVELGGRALGQGFAYGEIEKVEAFGPELRKLAERGLAEQVGKGWQFDWRSLLLWQGGRWTAGTQAFVWWVRDVVIAQTRELPAYDEWLANKRYRFLLTEEQWEWLVGAVRDAPEWAVRGIGGLAGALFEELLKRG